MPELPEVETVRRSLQAVLPDQPVVGVRVLRRDVVRPREPSRLPAKRLLKGLSIQRIDRHGKQLAIIAHDGSAVVVHLGMSGRLLLVEPGVRTPAPAHTHVEWRFGDDRRLRFVDPRRFGGLWAIRTPSQLASEHFGRLGPDALTVSTGGLREILGRTDRPLKALLLDQARLAGVGNIYADEALFDARLHPLTPATRATPHAERLARAIRETLATAVRAGGSTLRDYRHPDGQAGRAQRAHRVYGRAGLPCVVCESTLERGLVAQRTTVWCPVCQPDSDPNIR